MPRRKGEPVKKHRIQLDIPREEYLILNEMVLYYGASSRQDLLRYIAREWKEGGLCVFDKNSREVLIGAAREEILREARRVARAEIDARLWELGFVSSAPTN